MCRQVTCKECGRPSWAGCGAHVEQVLGDIPVDDRCPGHTADSTGGGGFLSRLFGRT